MVLVGPYSYGIDVLGRVAEPFSDDRGFGVDATASDPRRPVRMQSGGGGMASTAAGHARFLLAMLAGGTPDGHRVIGPQAERFMTAGQLGGVRPGPCCLPGPGHGLGHGVAAPTCGPTRRATPWRCG